MRVLRVVFLVVLKVGFRETFSFVLGAEVIRSVDVLQKEMMYV